MIEIDGLIISVISAEKIVSNNYPEPNSGCWIYGGSWTNVGYGTIGVGGRRVGVHRIALAMIDGPLVKGDIACHKCDVPCCVNPMHLFKGTRLANSADMAIKGRSTHGSKNPKAIINEAIALEIFNTPGSHRDIADKFGVSASTVQMIKQGYTWWRATGAPMRIRKRRIRCRAGRE
jgi:hypothetical protein